MNDKGSLMRNILLLGFVLGIMAAFVIRANLPDGMEKFSGLIFFGVIILVGGIVMTMGPQLLTLIIS